MDRFQPIQAPNGMHWTKNPHSLSGARILIVDDDPGIRALVSEILSSAGAETATVSNGFGALRSLSEEPIDLVTVDLMMPGMTGIEVCRRAHNASRHIALVVVSGSHDVSTAVEAMKLGALDYILKPFRPETVVDVVSRALDRNRQSLAEQDSHQTTVAEMLCRLNAGLHDGTEGVLGALVAALDAREHETKNHSRRVTSYAMRLAQAMNMDEEEIEILRRGAMLHDIGKIGVPDGTLLKCGCLTEEEWELMRHHPEIGYHILESIDDLRSASEIVLAHHERYDGRGYPKGLKGSEIIPAARIFAVADTLDAITSDRPYRRALSWQAASNELARCSGGQFDPEVVSAFRKIPIEVWARIRARTLEEDAP